MGNWKMITLKDSNLRLCKIGKKNSQNSSEDYIVLVTNSYFAIGHSFTDSVSAEAKLWLLIG